MKTAPLLDGEKIDGQTLDHIPIRGEDTGIPLKRLAGILMRNRPDDPVGHWWHGTLVVYLDWRLRALQEREGVPMSPDPESLILVAVIH